MESWVLQTAQRALAVARQAAERSGDLLLRRFHRRRRISYKAGAGNLVTDADHASEDLIVRMIRRAFPDHEVIAEERHAIRTGAPFRWYIDPLDGTANYAHGLPFFCISLALTFEGRGIMGVVYNPNAEERFTALRGRGAMRNGRSIAVSSTRTLGKSLLATGFPYEMRSKIANLAYFGAFVRRARAVRRLGSAALDLCYTACGILDGFWEFQLGAWDIAAAGLIAEEAGACVTDFSGRPVRLEKGEILAANRYIYPQMRTVIESVRRRS